MGLRDWGTKLPAIYQGILNLGSTSLISGMCTISSTAPTLVLTDTTASAKSLTVAVDANIANIRESAGAAGSLLVLDLANNRVGIGLAAPHVPLEIYSGSGIRIGHGGSSDNEGNAITFYPSSSSSNRRNWLAGSWQTGVGTFSILKSTTATNDPSVECLAIDLNGIVTANIGIISPYFQTSTAEVVPTGGSTVPLFGVAAIGGTGQPATAAQDGWIAIKNSAGATVWVPCWK